MNRYKKEEKRKHEQARKGLSEDQIAAIDLDEAIERRITKLAYQLHVEKFREEYDYRFDSTLEAILRSKGENPMEEQFIEEIRKKRQALGVSPLSESGMSISDDSMQLCIAEAKEQITSDIELVCPTVVRPPAKTCVCCGKSLQEVGGRRLIAPQNKGISLMNGRQNSEFQLREYLFVHLFPDQNKYIMLLGGKRVWTEAAVQRAVYAYSNGFRPWFCQVCGGRTCNECGSPNDYPAGLDMLNGDGSTSYLPVLPVDVGCTNLDCPENRK